jgi:hypothetical protein
VSSKSDFVEQKYIFLLIISIILLPSVTALQQTVGELTTNITAGNSSVLKYGIRNEENVSVTIKFNLTGDLSNYVEYPTEIIFAPNNFSYVELKVTIPDDYSGKNLLNGTIYALKEGATGGQVQLNIRLGKNINVHVIQTKGIESTYYIYAFILIASAIVIFVALKKKIKR